MKKRALHLLSGLLVFAMCFTCFNVPVYADTASELEDAKNKADELESEMSSLEEGKAKAEEELNAILKELEDLGKKIDEKKKEVKEEEQKLAAAKIEESEQYESMKMRIKFMYEDGNAKLVEVLLESKNIADFVSKAEYVKEVSNYDRGKLDDFKEVREKCEQKEKEVQEEYAELARVQDEMFAKQDEMNAIIENSNAELSELEASLSEANDEIEALKQKRQEELAAQSSGGSFIPGDGGTSGGSGYFAHPCPSSYISSPFGYRTFDNSFHNGTDFAASQGTPTYAAYDGTVVIAGWSNSAGNWVVINHGNGLVTKYMHHSALAVTAGQYVSRGQQIGYVGTTGYSTGPHLHFQVELNGTPVDPMGYL